MVSAPLFLFLSLYVMCFFCEATVWHAQDRAKVEAQDVLSSPEPHCVRSGRQWKTHCKPTCKLAADGSTPRISSTASRPAPARVMRRAQCYVGSTPIVKDNAFCPARPGALNRQPCPQRTLHLTSARHGCMATERVGQGLHGASKQR